jgi:hypothetical protein
MADYRKIALENLLNDNVVRLKLGIYIWHGITFEVVPYKKIKKGWSQYNKLIYKNIIYGYKELPD